MKESNSSVNLYLLLPHLSIENTYIFIRIFLYFFNFLISRASSFFFRKIASHLLFNDDYFIRRALKPENLKNATRWTLLFARTENLNQRNNTRELHDTTSRLYNAYAMHQRAEGSSQVCIYIYVYTSSRCRQTAEVTMHRRASRCALRKASISHPASPS